MPLPAKALSLANTQPRESEDICPTNDREWSDFSIYLALPLEHCLSAKGASLREAAKISVCRKIVGTNVFEGQISSLSLSVFLSYSFSVPSSYSLSVSHYSVTKNLFTPNKTAKRIINDITKTTHGFCTNPAIQYPTKETKATSNA